MPVKRDVPYLACRSTLKCSSDIRSRLTKTDKPVRHVLKIEILGMLQVEQRTKNFAGRLTARKQKPTVEELEAFRGLLLGICRTCTFTEVTFFFGRFTEVTKSQHTRVAHSGGKANPAYRAAQYDEA